MTQTTVPVPERWISGAPESRVRAADAISVSLSAAGAHAAFVPCGGAVLVSHLPPAGGMRGECAVTPLEGGRVQIAPRWGAGQTLPSPAQRETARWVARVLGVEHPEWANPTID